jgi:hypothetical protein
VVVLHLPTGAGVLAALPVMARVGYGIMDMAPELVRLSPDVYFMAPDRRIQRVAWATEGKGVTVETQGLIAEVLVGPQGLLAQEVSSRLTRH